MKPEYHKISLIKNYEKNSSTLLPCQGLDVQINTTLYARYEMLLLAAANLL